MNTLEEAFEKADESNIMDDHSLAYLARMMVPETVGNTLRVLHTPEMGDLRVIKMKNSDGHTEFHLHNYNAMPGASAPHETIKPFLHAVKLIHNEAAKTIDGGGSVQLQTNHGSPHMDTYKRIAERIANRAGKQVIDGGNKPLITMPFMSGPTIIIK